MQHDPVTEGPSGRAQPSPVLAAVLAGHRGDGAAARALLADPDPAVRAAALGALARCGTLAATTLRAALDDPAPEVRRRACDLAAVPPVPASGAGRRRAGGGDVGGLGAALARALGDPDPLVVEAACWALGERRVPAAVEALSVTAGAHPDPRCREAAVAAIGALGDRAGLPAVLAALGDRPAVRRRATVALAAFEGPDVDDALRRSAADRDWQVREVAEILLDVAGPAPEPPAGAPEPSVGARTPPGPGRPTG